MTLGGAFPSEWGRHRPRPLSLPPCGGAGTGQPWVPRLNLGAWLTVLSPSDQVASAGLDLIPGSSLTCRPILPVSAGHAHDSGLGAPLRSDAAFSDHALCTSGYVPYYRTPEEELHTSPGPPASLSGGRDPPEELPRCERSRSW